MSAIINIHYDDIDEIYKLKVKNKRDFKDFLEKIINLIIKGYEPNYYINKDNILHINKINNNNQNNYILRQYILGCLNNFLNSKYNNYETQFYYSEFI